MNFTLFSEYSTAVEPCFFDGPNTSRAREQIALRFVLPTAHPGAGWDVVVDTGDAGMLDPPLRLADGHRVAVVGRSLKMLRAWGP